MRKNLSELKRKASAEKQRETEVRVQATLQKMALHDLRKHRRTTQAQLSQSTGFAQSEISRIETRNNLTLGTLDTYVRGLGGALEVRAVFPEQVIAIDVIREQTSPAEKAA